MQKISSNRVVAVAVGVRCEIEVRFGEISLASFKATRHLLERRFRPAAGLEPRRDQCELCTSGRRYTQSRHWRMLGREDWSVSSSSCSTYWTVRITVLQRTEVSRGGLRNRAPIKSRAGILKMPNSFSDP